MRDSGTASVGRFRTPMCGDQRRSLTSAFERKADFLKKIVNVSTSGNDSRQDFIFYISTLKQLVIKSVRQSWIHVTHLFRSCRTHIVVDATFFMCFNDCLKR